MPYVIQPPGQLSRFGQINPVMIPTHGNERRRNYLSAMLPYCVYVLFSRKDGLLYIGFSGNLEKRLSEHQQGKCRSTCNRRPFELVFCEYYLFKEDALKREAYFKTNPGKKALKLMLRTTFLNLGYSATQALAIIEE